MSTWEWLRTKFINRSLKIVINRLMDKLLVGEFGIDVKKNVGVYSG